MKEYRVIIKKSHLVMARSIHNAVNIALDEFRAEVKKKIGELLPDDWWNKEWLEIEELFHVLVEEVEDA